MPLGFERINERTQRPNALINFIKPLPGPDNATSKAFLDRIAAQCYPVMKANHISVMALEEHEANPEFLGRNFNAGEVIQLVLKDKGGRWLGFKFVQMVMMHELAHCKQMNHSKFFWQVRNGYAVEMEQLWAKNYLGEGLWGRGQDLVTGSFVQDRPLQQGDVPAHLCGGTYRRRGRKRKRGGEAQQGDQKMTYAERQQRRIAKKFGVHGEGAALGEDELLRGAYEQGKRTSGKPRVAGSKRGRELRAQAALARFDAAKKQPQVKDEPAVKEEPDDDSDFDWSDSEFGNGEGQEGPGGMIKVCGDEGEEDEGGEDEMQQLQKMTESKTSHQPTRGAATRPPTKASQAIVVADDSETEGGAEEPSTVPRASHGDDDSETDSEVDSPETITSFEGDVGDLDATEPAQKPTTPLPPSNTEPRAPEQSTAEIPPPSIASSLDCPVCSLTNAPDTTTCMACAHVLRTDLLSDHWSCKSEACKGSAYINAGDAGRCGLCNTAKPAKRGGAGAGSAAGMGFTSRDVLRWD